MTFGRYPNENNNNNKILGALTSIIIIIIIAFSSNQNNNLILHIASDSVTFPQNRRKKNIKFNVPWKSKCAKDRERECIQHKIAFRYIDNKGCVPRMNKDINGRNAYPKRAIPMRQSLLLFCY